MTIHFEIPDSVLAWWPVAAGVVYAIGLVIAARILYRNMPSHHGREDRLIGSFLSAFLGFMWPFLLLSAVLAGLFYFIVAYRNPVQGK